LNERYRENPAILGWQLRLHLDAALLGQLNREVTVNLENNGREHYNTPWKKSCYIDLESAVESFGTNAELVSFEEAVS